MEPADRSELIIASVIFGIYIAFLLARRVCGTTPGFCGAAWIVFGIIFTGAAGFLILKVFR